MPAEPLFPPLHVPDASQRALMQDMLDVSTLAGDIFDALETGFITPPMARNLHEIAVKANRVREVLQSAVVEQLPGRHATASA